MNIRKMDVWWPIKIKVHMLSTYFGMGDVLIVNSLKVPGFFSPLDGLAVKLIVD